MTQSEPLTEMLARRFRAIEARLDALENPKPRTTLLGIPVVEDPNATTPPLEIRPVTYRQEDGFP